MGSHRVGHDRAQHTSNKTESPEALYKCIIAKKVKVTVKQKAEDNSGKNPSVECSRHSGIRLKDNEELLIRTTSLD